MNWKNIHIWLLTAALVIGMLGGVKPAAAAGQSPSEDEAALVDLINLARANPLEMAASLGMDPERVLEDLPDLEEILTRGLPPLFIDNNLSAAATAHTADMLANNYHSRISSDGRTPADRMMENGYNPVAAGETLGMLGFDNYIGGDEAAELIFESMFRAELDPGFTDQRNILNPHFKDIGVSLSAGAFTIADTPWNVYIAACDYAVNENYAVGLGVMRLINQLRAAPVSFIETAGVNETAAPQILADPGESLPALAWNESLYEAAGRHGEEMMREGRLDHISLDGSSPADRIEGVGYDAVRVDETIAAVMSEGLGGPMETARRIFNHIVFNPVDPANRDIARFLGEDIKEIGVHVLRGVLDPGEGNTPIEYYMVTIDFAEPLEPGNFLMGAVYLDLNGSEDLDDGEEAPPGRIHFKSLDGLWDIKAYVRPLGFYQVRLPVGFTEVALLADGADPLALGLHTFLGPGRNTMKDFRITDD